jgi:di/tricarboxylate transporter
MRLELLTLVALGAAVVAGLATVGWCRWQSSRGRGEVYQRSIPGLLLVVLAGVISLANGLARVGSPRFAALGFVATVVGLVGLVLVLQARRSSRSA